MILCGTRQELADLAARIGARFQEDDFCPRLLLGAQPHGQLAVPVLLLAPGEDVHWIPTVNARPPSD